MPRYYSPWSYGPGPGWGRNVRFRRGFAAAGVSGPAGPGAPGGRPHGNSVLGGPAGYEYEPPYESPQEEVEALKEEEGYLRGELEAIQKRLAQLETPSSS